MRPTESCAGLRGRWPSRAFGSPPPNPAGPAQSLASPNRRPSSGLAAANPAAVTIFRRYVSKSRTQRPVAVDKWTRRPLRERGYLPLLSVLSPLDRTAGAPRPRDGPWVTTSCEGLEPTDNDGRRRQRRTTKTSWRGTTRAGSMIFPGRLQPLPSAMPYPGAELRARPGRRRRRRPAWRPGRRSRWLRHHQG